MMIQKLFLLLLPFFLLLSSPVRVTVYHQKGITASGDHTDSIQEPFASISRDLLKIYPMNTRVKLENCPYEGIYLIKDKMNKRIKNGIDIYLTDDSRRYTPCMCEMSPYVEDTIVAEIISDTTTVITGE